MMPSDSSSAGVFESAAASKASSRRSSSSSPSTSSWSNDPSESSTSTAPASSPSERISDGRRGPRGDFRMNKAVEAKLADPEMTLSEALQIGGFKFDFKWDQPNMNDSKVFDEENKTLRQRKNQLSRRLKQAILAQQTAGATPTVDQSSNRPPSTGRHLPTAAPPAPIATASPTNCEVAAPPPEEERIAIGSKTDGVVDASFQPITAKSKGNDEGDMDNDLMLDLLTAIRESSDEDDDFDNTAFEAPVSPNNALISPPLTSEGEDDDDRASTPDDLRELLDSIDEGGVFEGTSPVTSTARTAVPQPVSDLSDVSDDEEAITAVGYTRDDMQDLLASIQEEEDTARAREGPPFPTLTAKRAAPHQASPHRSESDEMNSLNIPQPDPLPVRNKRRLVIPGTNLDLIQTQELLPPYRWLPVIDKRTNCIVDFVAPGYLPFLGKKCEFDEYGIRNCWILLVVHTLYSTVTYWGPGTEKFCIRPWIPSWIHNVIDFILSMTVLFVPMLMTNHFGPHAVKLFWFIFPQIVLHSFLIFNAYLLRREEKKLGVKQA